MVGIQREKEKKKPLMSLFAVDVNKWKSQEFLKAHY
jgi:hypothetical protein